MNPDSERNNMEINDEIIKVITEALREARSVEELADALLRRGVIFRCGKEFICADGREPLWCEECSFFKGGPDGEGICEYDGKPTWYACSLCHNYVSKRDCIISEENLRLRRVIGILEADVEERDKLLESRVEEVYPEFMRDYKQMREELEELYKEYDGA